jgi:hypothetical protein
VDEVERWKIRWALVDAKLERLLDTLHATNRDLYPAIYSIISIITDNTDVIGNKREIFQFDETLEILLKIDYWR